MSAPATATPATAAPARKPRSARFSNDLDITQVAPGYDRSTDSVRFAYQMSRRQKVNTLQLLIIVGAIWFISLVNGELALKYLLPIKVAPVVLMIAMALILGDSRSYGLRVAFGLGLCAIGNICFELEGSIAADVPIFLFGMGFFVAGLCTFLYAFSANRIASSLTTSALPVAYAAVVFNVLRPTVPASLLGPVFAYAAVIAALLFLAFSRDPEGSASQWSWRCACGGAAAFTVTSTLLGYNRFVGAVPHAKYIYTVCYYLAQYLITMSVKGARVRPLSKTLGSVEDFQKGQAFRTGEQ